MDHEERRHLRIGDFENVDIGRKERVSRWTTGTT